ncbi:MAG: amino acid ABC transporter permease [Clostridiales bacterium]|jgi:His/Glu/Gln/Arg/opine family amino acid ABC transporter permease subunit|nr:amino acid ABC transporter permease [Clostridiales bacterium]
MNIIKVLNEAFPFLLKGFGITMQTTFIALIIAIFLGLLSCLAHLSCIKIFSFLSDVYVWIIRGTPLIVQVFYIYFAIPQLIQHFGINFRISVFTASIITLGLNAGAYISEIFRGGVLAVDVGQTEAARSLGFSKWRSLIRVVLPQAIRISIPSLVNQFIISLKDTSIVSVISLGEIIYEAKIYIGRTMESFSTWTVVAIFYLIIVTILTQISMVAERNYNRVNKSQC